MTLTETKLHNLDAEINYCLAQISNLQARLASLEADRLNLRDEKLREETGLQTYEVER